MINYKLGYKRTKLGGQTKSLDRESDSESVVSVSDTYQSKIININTVVVLNLSRDFKGFEWPKDPSGV